MKKLYQSLPACMGDNPLVDYLLLQADKLLLILGSHSCKMYFQTSAGVDYLVDKASMTEVTANSNWKAQADLDIDRIRKSNITIR